MTGTFRRRFGRTVAEARRWNNPDGSVGGVVALGSRIYENVTLPLSVVVSPRAHIGYGVHIGDYGRIGTSAFIGDGAYIGNGAFIGDGSHIGSGSHIGNNAHIGDGVRIGIGVYIGDGVRINTDDWFFVAGPQGSHNALATAVYSGNRGLRWWVGCQRGITTRMLRNRVERYHGDTPMGDDYRYLIDMVERHPGLLRAEKAAKTAKARRKV